MFKDEWTVKKAIKQTQQRDNSRGVNVKNKMFCMCCVGHAENSFIRFW